MIVEGPSMREAVLCLHMICGNKREKQNHGHSATCNDCWEQNVGDYFDIFCMETFWWQIRMSLHLLGPSKSLTFIECNFGDAQCEGQNGHDAPIHPDSVSLHCLHF